MVTSLNLLTFYVDERMHAFAVEHIENIISMVTIKPISQASSITEGIINVHGEAVPVVDLSRFLGKPKFHYNFHTPIILINIKGHLVGLIVESVNDVISVPSTSIIHPKDILPEDLQDAALIDSVAYTASTFVLILNPNHLFHPDQIQVLSEASGYLIELVNSGKLEGWPQS